MNGKIFGLDFGTTNSALSVNIDGKVTMVDIDLYNTSGNTLKSVIYYDPEEKIFYVGQQAVNNYVENDAFGRYIQSIKAFLPDQSFDYTEIGRKTYKLDKLISIILSKIKDAGQDYIGEELNQVVIGRPVIFSEDSESDKLAVERLLSAAEIAGFNEIHFQYEPIAAALAFESTLLSNEEKILIVGDFGGGTSDFTVIKTKEGRSKEKIDRKEDILGLGGIYIGGDTFDSQLMWEKVAHYFGKDVRVKAVFGNYDSSVSPIILSNLRKWHLIPQLRHPKTRRSIKEIMHQADNPELIKNLENLIDYNYGYMLFQAIEKAKCELSSLADTTINFKELDLVIREDVNRIEFESFIASDIEKIDSCINDVIKQAGLNYSDIDLVFLTGGSSYIPMIKRIFIDKFGPEKIDQTNAFTSVAYGLDLAGDLYGRIGVK
jgi:hypothetical chaperone protein